jgi:hypothetical protein
MHISNPQKTPFFNGKAAVDTNSPGIGPDDVFRDPWGTPYIITLDLNYDNKCFDYTLNQMSQFNSPAPTGPLMVPGEAVVWSFGQMKTINTNEGMTTYSSINGNVVATKTNKLTIVTSF